MDPGELRYGGRLASGIAYDYRENHRPMCWKSYVVVSCELSTLLLIRGGAVLRSVSLKPTRASIE